VEFGEHVAHVMAGGLGGDEQPGRDLGVREALAEQPENLDLALGQGADVLGTGARGAAQGPHQGGRPVGVAGRAEGAEGS
jgi:hypothetical protein